MQPNEESAHTGKVLEADTSGRALLFLAPVDAADKARLPVLLSWHVARSQLALQTRPGYNFPALECTFHNLSQSGQKTRPKWPSHGL